MNHQDFINGNFDSDRWLYDFNYRYGNFGMSQIEHQVGQFGGSGSAAPIPTTELDENRGRLSAVEGLYEADPFANNGENLSRFSDEEEATDNQSTNQSEQARRDRQGTPYTYDRFGQLEGREGYGKEVIENYICNHHLYGEKLNYKDCGLTLWIQRAPQITDYLGGAAPALCLYRDCCLNQNRYIEPESIRIAFDEKTAPGHDPQVNAGYVHLKCLETYIPFLRQMFGKFNFKVEGRGPQKNGLWLRNPTIFSTISAIAYAEEYLEECRKESMGGDRVTDPILLSAGIEKQFRSQYPAAVQDVERKILELEGWDDMKALIDLKYAQACSTTPIASSIENQQQPRVCSSKLEGANKPSPSAYSKKNDHNSREKTLVVNQEQQQAGRRYGSESPITEQNTPGSLESPTTEQDTPISLKSSKGRHKKRDPHPKWKEPEIITEPQPLKKGEGKIKWRTFIRNGEEVWEQYEDLWSPLVSDLEENTEDDGHLEGDEPKPKRKRRLRGKRSKAKNIKQSGDDKDSEDDEPNAKRRRRSGDDEDSEEYEPRARRRLRSEDEEPRGHKRSRMYSRRRVSSGT